MTANYGFIYTQNLIKAAEALAQHCTDNRLLFHTHENRFVFYLVDYQDRNELIYFCDAIAKTLESLFAIDRIGGGIGILEIDQDQKEVEIDLLLRRLLIASEMSNNMYGKFETCFYDEELEALVTRERDVMDALAAIAAEKPSNDELFLQYQPIIDLRTGSICSFEALARLRSKSRACASRIYSHSKKTKLINLLVKSDYQSISLYQQAKELGYDAIGVSINISAIQL